MPAKDKGASSRKSGGKSRQKAKPRPSSPEKSDDAAPPEAQTGAERDASNFTRGVLIRGEAARPDESGELPSGATHEIVGEDEEGTPVIQRRRYSAF